MQPVQVILTATKHSGILLMSNGFVHEILSYVASESYVSCFEQF